MFVGVRYTGCRFKYLCFFFSSRRRHTRWTGDWSSDVCSSDLADHQIVVDVPANRPDLLCHKGAARELGASIGAVVKLPAIPGGPADSRTAGLSARPSVRQSAAGV